jgi:hypothetical protein
MINLKVDTDTYLKELMEEHSDRCDMNSEVEDTDPRIWLESRIRQLDNIECMATLELKKAHLAGYLTLSDYQPAQKKYEEAFEGRMIDAAYKCNEALILQNKDHDRIAASCPPGLYVEKPDQSA